MEMPIWGPLCGRRSTLLRWGGLEHPEEAEGEVSVWDSYYCHFNPHFSKITATINS